MKIQLKYFAQIKKETGKSSEELEFENGVTLQDCIKSISNKYSNSLNKMLFDESGAYRDTVVLVINNIQTRYSENPKMNDNDEILLMSPIAGG